MKVSSPVKFALIAIIAGLITGTAMAQDNAIVLPLDPEKGERFKRPTDPGASMPAMQRIDAGLTPYMYERGTVVHREEETTHAMSLHIIKIDRLFKLKAGHGLAPNPSKIVEDAAAKNKAE